MRFLRFLGSRWSLSFLGTALLAAIVWFLGPLLVESPWVRGAIVLAAFALWLGINLWIDRRRRGRDRALIAGAAADPASGARAEEQAGLRDKLTTALALLRRASGSRGYLYEQPWYVIIGPPGAGKTTALLNAGLKFPLAAEMGQGAVAGVGGTRSCDWWFTEQAVLIDTAGRYTTQDSDASVDSAGWQTFLDLLRRTRPRQPLNGVLVAIGAPDLAEATPAERLDHARAVRRRLKELTDRLGVRLPVYLLFTKADLLAGFSEYFDDLDAAGRAQVWGHSFAADEAEPANRFAGALEALRARLEARLVDRLQAERSADRRALLVGFPAQLGSLAAPLGEFAAEAFGASRLDPAPWLRGFYFTSGTQAGTPIDRLTGALARGFGVDQARLASLRPQQGRAYFLAGLLRLVFGEAMLASTRPGAARRRLLRRGAAFAGIALATLLAAGGLLAVRGAQQAEAARMTDAVARYEALANGQTLDPVASDDLAPILPVLDAARGLPHGEDAPPEGAGLGLSQGSKYRAGARLLYAHALQRILLPRLMLRLEAQIRDHLQDPAYLYEAMRVYLMFGGRGPLDRDVITAWELRDWQSRYPDPADQADLARHLAALLGGPLQALAGQSSGPDSYLNGELVAEAQRAFSRVTPAERVYSRIQPQAESAGLAPWTPEAALGGADTGLFYRASGKPLSDGIPGFFTPEGFYRVLLPRLPEAAREVAGESWVLGHASEIDRSPAGLSALQRDVVTLYTGDYARAWDGMIADLQIAPLPHGEAGVRALYLLSSPESPMRDLLVSMAKQLTLAKPPADIAAAEGAAAQIEKAAGGAAARLASLLGPASSEPPPGAVIDARYAALRHYAGTGSGQAPVDFAIKILGDMQQQLAGAVAGASGSAAQAASGVDAAQLLRAETARAPEPAQRWLLVLASGSNAARAQSAALAAKAAWGGGGAGGGGGGGGGGSGGAALAGAAAGTPGGLCMAAATSRYPFVRGAAADIPLDDFSKLFAPGGALDAFFNAQIAPFVDKSGRVWRLQSVNGVPPPISAGDLAEFQRAAAIRDLFFGTGALAVRFGLTPDLLDTGAKQVTLDLGGSVLTYAHGPARETEFTWPGQGGMNDVRLSFDPPPASGGAIEAHGPWALFRLIDQGTLTPGATHEEYLLSFFAGDRQARFRLRAGSVLNPFGPGILQGFRCPTLR